jgi:hypothetical protein
MTSSLQALAGEMVLGGLLGRLGADHGGFELLDHWTQGEFHHDVVLRVKDPKSLPGPILVVATNCNGGIKEVLAFATIPDRWALWHHRCPTNPEFTGALTTILARATTLHWFDPCELLTEDARSELLPEHRTRQPGGGWCRR